MNLDESRMWHQPIRPLREWFQEDLIARVREKALNAGHGRAAIFDAEENLQWRSPSDEAPPVEEQ